MMPFKSRVWTFAIFLGAAQVAFGQSSESPTTESRDASIGNIFMMDTAVRGLERECLPLIERSNPAASFQKNWWQRNEKYLVAGQTYMSARFSEAEALGGAPKRESVQKELVVAAAGGAQQILKSWLASSDKPAACRRAAALIEAGVLDFTPTSPMYIELESLVAWASRQSKN